MIKAITASLMLISISGCKTIAEPKPIEDYVYINGDYVEIQSELIIKEMP